MNEKMNEKIEELTLLLMYLTSWDEEGLYYNGNTILDKAVIKNTWKSYSFAVINKLTNEGYLFQSNYKNKSVALTKEGEKLAELLIKKYIK